MRKESIHWRNTKIIFHPQLEGELIEKYLGRKTNAITGREIEIIYKRYLKEQR